MNDEKKNKIRYSLRVKLTILFVLVLLIVLMFPKGESIESEITIGSIWIEEDLIASKTFEILKSKDLYAKEQKEAGEKIHQIFLRDSSAIFSSLDSISNYNSYIIRKIIPSSKTSESIEKISFLSKQSIETIKNRFGSNLSNRIHGKSFRDFLSFSKTILERIYQRGLLNINYGEIKKDSIALRDGRFERIVPKRIFLDYNSQNDYINLYFRNSFGGDNSLNSALTEYLDHFLKPNIIYSPVLTEKAIEQAKDRISKNIGIVNENERIIAKHDRITPESKLKIDSYRIAKGEEIGLWGRLAQLFGKFLHIILIIVLLIIYQYLFRKKLFNDNLKLLLIAILILFISFLTFIVFQINVKAPVEYLVLVPVASMLLTIIFDSRVGFYGTIVIALTCGGLRGNDYVFSVINILAGAFAAYTVRDIKNRTQIFRSFLFIFLGYALGILAFGLERFESYDQILITAGFAFTNALVSPILTYGLIIFIEKIFKITTDLTLLELTDFNRPGLKEIARSAPGTFTHSMTIGTMVESAAEAIGAKPILARVGAYYHDLGKIIDPSSFVENQMDKGNKHEDLSPEESANIILEHVSKGIELAKRYQLPQEIIDFIPMHHGTLVISFFYEKAKELYGEENVDIKKFRYQGPKPNTKETALVMLADACESTVRAMNDPEPGKIENVINNLINYRISDGQLNDAPITFADITKIKQSFLASLVMQHHKRIRYPNQSEIENKSTGISG